MGVRKGFSLMEIVAVMVIMGILAAFVIPNIMSSMEQTRAQAAKNNLLSIAAAQQKFYEDYGSYCLSAGTVAAGIPAACADNLSDIAKYLKVGFQGSSVNANLDSNNFSYSCAAAAPYYTCTAFDSSVTLTLTDSTAGAVFTCGGASCPS